MREAQRFEDEVDYGLDKEEAILRRWCSLSPDAKDARGFLKGGTFDDFDFVIFDKWGVVSCYLEVKSRRKKLSSFGDAMAPIRKHRFATYVLKQRLTAVLMVTEYACGSLVQVNLADKPASQRDIARRDRPKMKPVPHGFWAEGQMTVLAGANLP